MNRGAVCIWTPASFPRAEESGKGCTLFEHYAPDFNVVHDLMQKHAHASQAVKEYVGQQVESDHLRDNATSAVRTPHKIESKVLSYVREMIVVRKAALWKEFQELDIQGDYYVTPFQWTKACSAAIGSAFPWDGLMSKLCSKEMHPTTGDIQYVKFLARYTVRFDSKSRMYAGWQDKVLVITFGRFVQKGLDFQQTLNTIDPDSKGTVDAAGMQMALQRVGANVTESQAVLLLRSVCLAVGESPAASQVTVMEFLTILAAMFSSERKKEVTSQTCWVPKVLPWLGDQMVTRGMSIVDVFRTIDADSSGYLEFAEVEAFLLNILDPGEFEEQIEESLRVWASSGSRRGLEPDFTKYTNQQRLHQMCEYISIAKPDAITLLEFMTAFAQHPGTEHLQRELMEQICVTLHENKVALMHALRKYDKQQTGLVTKQDFLDALSKLNAVLGKAKGGAPLSDAQTQELCENLTWDNAGGEPVIRYEEFIESFKFVDLEASKQKGTVMVRGLTHIGEYQV